MSIPASIAKNFVKQIQEQNASPKEGSTHYGTVKVVDGEMYVTLDGSTVDTPASTAVGVQSGDRVQVDIRDHSALITTNFSSTPIGESQLEFILSGAEFETDEDSIITNTTIINSKFENGLINGSIMMDSTIVGSKFADGTIENSKIADSTITGSKFVDGTITDSKIQDSTLTGSKFKDGTITGTQIAESTITDSNIKDSTITGSKLKDATIESAKIDYASFEKLEGKDLQATQAAIDKLLSVSIKVGDIVAEDGTIKSLKSEDLHAATGYIGTLVSNDITANKIVTGMLKVENLEADYAKIDFANVDVAHIKEAWIQDLMVQGKIIAQEGTIYYLDAVEINADKITAGTLKANRLLLEGEGGLFYEINATAAGVTSEELSTDEYQAAMHGSKIIAESITADKITVSDLQAFGADIGGWHITDNSLYSSTRSEYAKADAVGVYLGSEGSLDIGSDDQYIRFDPVTGRLYIRSNSIELTATESLTDRLTSMESKIIQNADDILLAFGNSNDLGDDWNVFRTYFKFGKLEDMADGVSTIDGVEIGKNNTTDATFKTRITNAGIAFIDDTTLQSYIANDNMYTSNSTIMGTLRFNDFVWIRRDNGNMSLKHLNVNDPTSPEAIPNDIYDMFGVPNPNFLAGGE